MVWKNNFLIDGIPFTYEKLIDDDYFKDPKDAFRLGLFLDTKHFPQHIIFGNFQCLRCGLCCKNHDWIQLSPGAISEWRRQNRKDILKYVNNGDLEAAISWTGCHFCRKAPKKPYYGCRINEFKEYLFDCKIYVCSKSLPMANINYKDVDELIQLIGLTKYYDLIEKDWNENFDFSKCGYKTHKKGR
jgi:hypothetical protein